MKSEIEFQSNESIEAFQLNKLNDILSYVTEYSPFYKNHFKNISALPLKSLFDLEQLPSTSKDHIQNSNWDFLCVSKDKIVEYCTTSGTLGKPVTIALSFNDVKRLGYNEAISFSCADGSSSDFYQLMLTMDRGFMAGIAYYEGIRKLGASLVRVGPGLPQFQWETIERLKPTTLVAVPSFVVKLLEYASVNGINCNDSSVKKIICIGENIRDQQLQLNTLGTRIQNEWQVTLYSTYASTEMQTAFTECKSGSGGHLHPELLYVELLDEQGKAVAEGDAGEITITTLGVEAMPLIRYRTGDIARMHKGPCVCGRNSLRIGPIEGRKQHMLKFKGTTVYPPALLDLLAAEKMLQDFVVEAYKNPMGGDEIKIYVLPQQNAGNAEMKMALVSRFQSVLRVTPEIEFVDRVKLDVLNANPGSPKIRKFIDSRVK